MNGQRPLNIALLRRCLDPSKGGAEKVAARFVREFLRRGHRITFYGEEIARDAVTGVQWIKIPKRGLASSPTTRFHHNVQKELAASRHYYDVVFAMCRTWPVDVFRVTEQLHAEWLPLNYPRPMQLMPRHRAILKLEKETLDPANVPQVITNSELIRQQVIKRYNFPAENITRIPNGVDRDFFFPTAKGEKNTLRQQLNLPENRLVLLFVAANFRTKRLDLAIKAVAGLDENLRKNILLTVVGGDKPDAFRRQAEQCGIDIRFTGKASEMRQYYAAADLLYYPSPYEPFANVCLEAAACGLPVLTTSMNGSCELVDDQAGGYVVSKINATGEIRQALTDFAQRPPENRREMSSAILAATADYTWEKHADMLEKIFYKVRKRA